MIAVISPTSDLILNNVRLTWRLNHASLFSPDRTARKATEWSTMCWNSINLVCAQKVRIALKEKGQEAKEYLDDTRVDAIGRAERIGLVIRVLLVGAPRGLHVHPV